MEKDFKADIKYRGMKNLEEQQELNARQSNSYEQKQKNKFKSIKFAIFIMCYIFSFLVIIGAMYLTSKELLSNVGAIIQACVYGVFGLAGVVVGGKVIQNRNDAKFILGKGEKNEK